MPTQTTEHMIAWVPERPTHAVVFLHGLGATGHDLFPLSQILQEALGHPAILWQFPHAGERPVTLNGGMVMPAWFDLYGIDRRVREDVAGIEQAAARVWQQLQAIHDQGIPWDRIVLAGFSQGGALALYTALSGRHQLAGVASFSGYLPQRRSVLHDFSLEDLPVWLAHGREDTVVPFEFFTITKDALSAHLPKTVTAHALTMGHEISQEALAAFVPWLQQSLSLIDSTLTSSGA